SAGGTQIILGLVLSHVFGSQRRRRIGLGWPSRAWVGTCAIDTISSDGHREWHVTCGLEFNRPGFCRQFWFVGLAGSWRSCCVARQWWIAAMAPDVTSVDPTFPVAWNRNMVVPRGLAIIDQLEVLRFLAIVDLDRNLNL